VVDVGRARRRSLARLTKEGDFLVDTPGLYRRTLRVARFIEYGGQLQKGETRETQEALLAK
jgi:hypothetical protein